MNLKKLLWGLLNRREVPLVEEARQVLEEYIRSAEYPGDHPLIDEASRKYQNLSVLNRELVSSWKRLGNPRLSQQARADLLRDVLSYEDELKRLIQAYKKPDIVRAEITLRLHDDQSLGA